MKAKLIFILAIGGLGSVLLNGCSSSDEAFEGKHGGALFLDGGISTNVAPQEINPWGYELLDDSLEGTLSKVNKFMLDDEAKTRAPQDNTWANMSDRNLSVMVGSTVYKYSVAANGAITSTTPYYFTTTSNVSVSAWYPWSSSLTSFSVQANQSTAANYEKSFLLYGTMTTNHNYLSNSITFAHKTAKLILTVKFTGAKYVLNSTINSLKINGAKITGTVSNGTITGTSGSATEITPYCKSASSLSGDVVTAVYEVSLIPQTATLALTINDGGVTYHGTVPSTAYIANSVYTVTVNMNATPQAVNLGLPSGLKWANKNVGSHHPADYGGYYAWAETSTKSNYAWETYLCSSANCGTNNDPVKAAGVFSSTGNGFSGNATFDVARKNWGGTWRMPTIAQWQELVSNCTWTWTTQNGITGYVVKSKTNSNSIFLPAGGNYHGTALNYRSAGSFRCCYWSSNYNASYANYGLSLGYGSSGVDYLDDDGNGSSLRSSGFSVRAVSD